MDEPIWVDQTIEKIVTYSPLEHLLVARSGITTLNILYKTLKILGASLNISYHIKSRDIKDSLDLYYINALISDRSWIDNMYNYYFV